MQTAPKRAKRNVIFLSGKQEPPTFVVEGRAVMLLSLCKKNTIWGKTQEQPLDSFLSSVDTIQKPTSVLIYINKKQYI